MLYVIFVPTCNRFMWVLTSLLHFISFFSLFTHHAVSFLIRVKTESRCRKLVCRTFKISWTLLYYLSFSFFKPWRKTLLLKSRFSVTQTRAPYPPKVPQAMMPLLTNRADQSLRCCGDTSHFFLSSWWPRASNRRITREMDLFTLKLWFVPVFATPLI